MLTTILATIVVLGVLILVHELGHFWAAKAVDIEVSRFSIGFGPKLLSFRRGETEYVLAAIPLGGYVKMEGMSGDEGMEPLEGPGAGPARQPSDRDFDAKPWRARFFVIVAGVLMNFAFAIVAFTCIAKFQGVLVPMIGKVVAGTPAEATGFLEGDIVLRADGKRMGDWSSLVRYVSLRPEVPIVFEVERGAEVLEIEAAPATAKIYEEMVGDSVVVGQLGVWPSAEGIRRPSWAGAAVAGWNSTGEWTATIFEFLGRVVTGKTSSKELGGPIAIGQLSGQAARQGIWAFLSFMGIISVNLAVLNLLPIPVLDGGHLLFLFLEAIRGGRPVSVSHRLRLTQIGLILVMGIMVLAFANDILRLVRI